MFKKFLKMIADCGNRNEAYTTVFYGKNGIYMTHEQGKLSCSDYYLLLRIIGKMA